MSISLKWDITHKCNLFCSHCIMGDVLNNSAEEPTLDEIKKIIDNLGEKEIGYIHLLGGEPTVREDIYEVLRYLDKKNIPFGFNTNGLLVGKESFLREVIPLNALRNIVFSIEAPIAEVNDAMRGKKVFDATVTNLKKVVKCKKTNEFSQFHITVNMVVSQENKQYVLEMINFCISLGVDELCLLQLIPQGNAADKKMVLDFVDEVDLVVEIADIFHSVKNELKIVPRFVYPIAADYAKIVLDKDFPPVEHGCGAGTDFAYITNQGLLYPCDRYVGHISERYESESLSLINNAFDDIWKKDCFSDIFRKLSNDYFYQHIEPCNLCAHLKETCHPCPVEPLCESGAGKMGHCFQYATLIQQHKRDKLSLAALADRKCA